MPERWGTIFEVSAKKAVRHRVREQDKLTDCNRLIGPSWAIIHDKPLEARCPKCYPFQRTPKRKVKPWPTSSKKK